MGNESVVNKKWIVLLLTTNNAGRAITKISSRWVYEISGQGIEELGSSFGFISLLFPMKVARGYAHRSQGKIPGPWLLVTALTAG